MKLNYSHFFGFFLELLEKFNDFFDEAIKLVGVFISNLSYGVSNIERPLWDVLDLLILKKFDQSTIFGDS